MIRLSNKKIVSRFIILVLLLTVCFSSFVYADDLNGVGDINGIGSGQNTTTETEETTTKTKKNGIQADSPEEIQKNKNNAKAVGDMFSNVGIDKESIEQANEYIRPFAKFLNKVMAVILGATSLLMMFVTVLDMLYMAFPPIRDYLDGGSGGRNQSAGGRGSRSGMGMRSMGGMHGMGGMGMSGGMGMGMGGMGMDGGMGSSSRQQSSVGGGLSALGRWISDEAMASCVESGGGPMAGINGSQQGPIKSMLFSYMKKRSMFLILFGVCVILFTSTVFTDLGIKIGTWLIGAIMGLGN